MSKNIDKKSPVKEESRVADARSEILALLEQLEEELVGDLHPEDARADPQAAKIRKVRRLMQQSGGAVLNLPRYKVRIFWEPTDVLLRAADAPAARDLALDLATIPQHQRVQVMAEDPSKSWTVVNEFK